MMVSSQPPNQPAHFSMDTCNEQRNYPPLSGSKHLCSICGDRASGKHYGVFSCEGCKGFFKRTVRKELTYVCRESRKCLIDKRQRNRCQACRYTKCLVTGMRREAVQEERHRGVSNSAAAKSATEIQGERSTHESDNFAALSPISSAVSTGGTTKTISVTCIGAAEAEVYSVMPPFDTSFSAYPFEFASNALRELVLRRVVKWAQSIPHFNELSIDDRTALLRDGWNDLLISQIAYQTYISAPILMQREVAVRQTANVITPTSLPHPNLTDYIVWGNAHDLATGSELATVFKREKAFEMGNMDVFDRIQIELCNKMRELNIDTIEMGCLRAIILFNPDADGLDKSVGPIVEGFREHVYSTLEEYTRNRDLEESSRFAKLLLRLPAIRSITLTCMESLFFNKVMPYQHPPPSVDPTETTFSNNNSVLLAPNYTHPSLIMLPECVYSIIEQGGGAPNSTPGGIASPSTAAVVSVMSPASVTSNGGGNGVGINSNSSSSSSSSIEYAVNLAFDQFIKQEVYNLSLAATTS